MWVESTEDRLVIGTTLPVTADQAWRALTDPAMVARWWGPRIRFDARAGGSLTERWADSQGRTTLTQGRVVWFEPPRRLVLGWSDDGWPGETTVEFRLEKDGERVWLRLEHRGWDAFPATDRATLIDRHCAGWRHHLTALGAALAL